LAHVFLRTERPILAPLRPIEYPATDESISVPSKPNWAQLYDNTTSPAYSSCASAVDCRINSHPFSMFRGLSGGGTQATTLRHVLFKKLLISIQPSLTQEYARRITWRSTSYELMAIESRPCRSRSAPGLTRTNDGHTKRVFALLSNDWPPPPICVVSMLAGSLYRYSPFLCLRSHDIGIACLTWIPS
jgi:hypothetical protein